LTKRRSAAFAATCLVTLAAIAPANAAGHHSRHRASTRTRTSPSTSRGASGAQSAVVGRLGQVISDNARIYGGRDRGQRLLSVCTKDQYLAINSETSNAYGILMQDRSVGYISKSDVKLLAFQVVDNETGQGGDQGATAQSCGTDTMSGRIVQQALTYLTVPYLWGGETRGGIDCSGFVKAVFETEGINLPRVAREQVNVGYAVPMTDVAQWMPGDRMYFECHHPEVDHTALYIGNGEFIHASAGHGHQVAIDSVYNKYYWGHLVAVRRSTQLYDDQQAHMRQADSSVDHMATTTNVSQQTAVASTSHSGPANYPDTYTRDVHPAMDSLIKPGDAESGQQ